MPKLLQTSFVASSSSLASTRSGVLAVRGFLIDTSGSATLRALSIAQGWLYSMGREYSLITAQRRLRPDAEPFNPTHFAQSRNVSWMVPLTDPYLYPYEIKTKDTRRQRRSFTATSLRSVTDRMNTDDADEDEQGAQYSRTGTIGVRYRPMPQLPIDYSDSSSDMLDVKDFTQPFLTWAFLNAACKAHLIDQEIFVDAVETLEQGHTVMCESPLLKEAPAITAHGQHSPFVTPLICLRRFCLLPGSVERIVHALTQPGSRAPPMRTNSHHYNARDGDEQMKHELFPFPMYNPSKWSIFQTLPPDLLSDRVFSSACDMRFPLETILCPFSSTLRYLQGLCSAVEAPLLRYNTRSDEWVYPAAYVASDIITAINLSELFNEYTVPLPESMCQLMQRCPFVDLKDLAHPSNNHLILVTCLYRLWYLYKLASVASQIGDLCLDHMVHQVIDGHVPLLTMITEHCMFQDDMLLAPWPSDHPLAASKGYQDTSDRSASHPCAPNSFNEFAGIHAKTESLVELDSIPRVFFVWPSDVRWRVSLEDTPSLSAAISDVGIYVRKREARTATQDWSDPGLALKALLTKSFPLKNFKRSGDRVSRYCFDAHPSIGAMCLSLLHVSQIGNVPGATKASLISRLRYYSLHHTTPAIASRNVWYISSLCYSTWLTFFRVSLYELFGFYMINCLPALASTVFSHPRQGILYLKRVVGLRYMQQALRRRYCQVPFILPDLSDAMQKTAVFNTFIANAETVETQLFTQEIMTLRENDMLTKRIGVHIHHATETESMTRDFWIILDQLYTRVLTTLRFLHRARAPWSPASHAAKPKDDSDKEFGDMEHASDDDDEEEDADDDEEEGRARDARAAAYLTDHLSGPALQEFEDHLENLGSAIDHAGMELDDGRDDLNIFGEVDGDENDADREQAAMEARAYQIAQTVGQDHRHSGQNNVDDDDDDEQMVELLRQLDSVTRGSVELEMTEDQSVKEFLTKRQAQVEHEYGQALSRVFKARDRLPSNRPIEKLVTPDGLEAWSLTDEQMNVVMTQFVRSISYVPVLDDPGREEFHELFRQVCYFVQRYSRPSSQEDLPFVVLRYFGLSIHGLRFLHNQRLYDRAGIPTNSVDTKTRLFWLKHPTDFALISRFFKYVQLYSADQMLLLPREVAELQMLSRVKSTYGNPLCFHIAKEQLCEQVRDETSSRYQQEGTRAVTTGLQISGFCMNCRNWTEPLAPSVSTMYSENRNVPIEERKFARKRVATGVVTEGRAARQTACSRRASTPDHRKQPNSKGSKSDAAAERISQRQPQRKKKKKSGMRVRISHLPNIDIRRTACDFTNDGSLICLSDARSRSVGFSAIVTEMAYGRGMARLVGERQELYPGIVQFFTAARISKWLAYARLVNLFPLRPEQLDALLRQVSEIYPELAARIKENGFIATSITASCPADMLDVYVQKAADTYDEDIVGVLEQELAEEDDDEDGSGGGEQGGGKKTGSTQNNRTSKRDSDTPDTEQQGGTGKRRGRKPKTGISKTMDPELQKLLAMLHYDKRVRVGITNGMRHQAVLSDGADVIRDGIRAVPEFSRHNTHNICGVKAEKINMIGRIFFAVPHTHSIIMHTPYVMCSLCPSTMRAIDCQWSDNPGVGYVCAKHSGCLRRIDPNNCELDQVNAGGGGAYFPRVLSLNPHSCSKGVASELVMSESYVFTQASQYNGIPPQWLAAQRQAGFPEIASFWQAGVQCTACEPGSNIYAHVHMVVGFHRTTGLMVTEELCEQCYRKHYSPFSTRFPAAAGERSDTTTRRKRRETETDPEEHEEQDEEGNDEQDGLDGSSLPSQIDSVYQGDTYGDVEDYDYGI